MADTRKPTEIEAHLVARLKLQRVIFGSCALVLVTLAVLGMSAYRTMQRDLLQARSETADTAVAKRNEAARADDLAETLEVAREETRARTRQLALEKCRLAAQDLALGNEARARALVQEAIALGPPPWAQLLLHRLKPGPARIAMEGNAPVISGALSGDRKRAGVVRAGLGRGTTVEIYALADGKLLTSTRLPDGGTSGDLALDHTGARFAVRHNGELLLFDGELRNAHRPDPDEADPVSAWSMAAADASLRHAALGAPGVVARLDLATGRLTVLHLPEPEAELRAVLPLADGGVAAVAGPWVLRHDGKVWTRHELRGDQIAGAAALYDAGAMLIAAGVFGREIVLSAIDLRTGASQPWRNHTLSPLTWTRAQFMADGTLLCSASRGTVALAGPGAVTELEVSGSAVTFGALGPDGLVFGNEGGETSVRVLEAERELGRALMLVPPGCIARAEAGGFVLTTDTGFSRVHTGAGWVAAGTLTRVVPAGAGWAAQDGESVLLPWGETLASSRDGALAGAWPDGTVLLQKPGELLFLGPEIRFPCALAATGAPDDIALAATAHTAVLRFRDSLYLATARGPDARPLTDRAGLAPDMLALSADGRHVAAVVGQTVNVLAPGSQAQAVRVASPPRAVALLFEGSVIASAEMGSLAYYEVVTGRLLLRRPADVTALHAAGDNALHLVEGGRMRVLHFSE
ncbi:MAG: hypothetical protein KF696_05730 [Planctomycetes bacterium]|nr:hypothetical protein [Planctomycetota bacterium]MCW8136386.1 hypothetical protein [Planctomycetota bacterium]